MKKLFSIVLLAGIIGTISLILANWQTLFPQEQPKQVQNDYWFVLHRKTQKEELLQGIPGDRENSKRIKTFQVKTGRHVERPTPLPQLLGREYWIITKKQPEPNNPETAPYFITLDVPAPSEPPYGPSPYLECNGQCDWVRPGDFGLHGIAGNPDKLSKADPGSSGCIRHTDEDITYLYNLLDPNKGEIRYYIEDN
jgi:lipoprotein-anchoring transpeptidase ErfK/SrfK